MARTGKHFLYETRKTAASINDENESKVEHLDEGAANLLERQIVCDTQNLTSPVLCHDLLYALDSNPLSAIKVQHKKLEGIEQASGADGVELLSGFVTI